jgi:hypothetical protein
MTIRRRPLLFLNLAWIAANVAVYVLGLSGGRRPLSINDAYSQGIQLLSGGHADPGPVVEIFVLASMLASIRSLALAYRVYFSPSPIEVHATENTTGQELNMKALDVAFREHLASPRIYQVTTVPGDPDPDRLIEILQAPTYGGWRGILAAAYSYAIPRRAFIVSATLRLRDEAPCYGASARVRRLPSQAFELETQWSTSFERALKRTAFAVAANILPQTRFCQDIPWTAWRGRELPTSLFRDYQRAKVMVGERRYDEALYLYHRALRKDANNVGLQYDVGQLYERLRLYPDALFTYLHLVNQIFPTRTIAKNGTLRRSTPRAWPSRQRDPYVIWYRYVVTLGTGPRLAEELLFPRWSELQGWLSGAQNGRSTSDRPWRFFELREMRRAIAEELERIFPSAIPETRQKNSRLFDSLSVSATDTPDAAAAQMDALERYLLTCAARELGALRKAFRADRRLAIILRRSSRRGSSLTRTAIRQTETFIAARLRRLDTREQNRHDADGGIAPRLDWRYRVPELTAKLREAGYSADSTSWLEHYNAACIYAFPLIDDSRELEEHAEYARAAVAALQRALRCGEDVDFVRAKRYWLQAGDPDLTGLRHYECFRAFEARVYGRPLPAFGDIARFELYLYLRQGLEAAARNLSAEWTDRDHENTVACAEFERWWRQEEQAWRLVIRLGRFYRQWQTRWEIGHDLRAWIESAGVEARPAPWPNLTRTPDEWDASDTESAGASLLATEQLFAALGMQAVAGQSHRRIRSWNRRRASMKRLVAITSSWADYARARSRLANGDIVLTDEVISMIRARAGVWAALRQWAEHPEKSRASEFAEAIARLQQPPSGLRPVKRGPPPVIPNRSQGSPR